MNEPRAGSAERLLALIGEHRDTIRSVLDGDQHALLLDRLRALAVAPADDDRSVRRALQGVRLVLLKLPPGHPVRRELESWRLAVTLPGPETVAGAQELLAWFHLPSPACGPAYEPDPGRDRLLGQPALSAAEAWGRCGGAPPAELIRLRGPDYHDHYPEFQFTPAGGAPNDVVLEINRLLLADIDPWGAAAWWLSGNTWLGGSPASLLGRLPDHRLVGAALELAEGE
ncbi:hypothetical protein [Streptomyces sp. NRRL S-1022]|uniref:hypothetical protein n=1 Tax=Streptomyces sp. NRRL S-1022 TaxID=1463880 RepID=UPI0004BF9EB6|nr:hypothetical protein [Streptomyces sp. NRRL S-1022]